uniref:SWIM-type domain-containing protein n=1 Tax=Trypanosoma congolense (strain IL3000) TaxID=1068625 RepID=G0USF4_TRYCI|nr:conserved hypothetical protein [Trypanosoma congolense IL3000]
MLEKYLSSIIVPYLSKFVENLDSKQLNVDLWNGNVVLKDLILKKSVVDALLQGEGLGDDLTLDNAAKTMASTAATRLPLTMQRGICKRVNIVVPYTQLRSKPVVVEIGELHVCIKGNTESGETVVSKVAKLDALAVRKARELDRFEAERKRAKENSANNPSNGNTNNAATGSAEGAGGASTGPSTFPSADAKGKDGYFSRLGELVINNIVVKIQSVHVRYEDEATKTVAGVILGDVRLYTIDLFTGAAKFVDPVGMRHVQKRLEFDGLQFYCDDPSRYDQNQHEFFISKVSDMSKWLTAMRERVERGNVVHSTMVGPVKGHVDVDLILKDFIRELIWEPYLKVRMRLDSFNSRFNRAQYLTVIRTVSLLSNWTGLTEVMSRRPKVPVIGHAPLWWRYSINAVRAATGAPRRERLLQRISEVCTVDYHILYRDVVRKAEMSPEKQRAYRFITRFMTVPDMIAGRKYVYAQLANVIQLKRKDNEAKKAEAQPVEEDVKQKGWFSWVRRQPSIEQPVEGEKEREEARALEELEREYGLDIEGGESNMNVGEDEDSKLPESYCWLDAQFELPVLCTSIDLSKTVKAELTLNEVGLLVKTFNLPNSVQIRFVTDNLTLSNPIEDEAVRARLPSLIEALPFICDQDADNITRGMENSHSWRNIPLLECSAALNPVQQPVEDTHLDFTMSMRLLPLRIVADPPTIDSIARFFQIPKGLDVGYIVSRTKDFAATVGEAASTELRQAMTNTKGYKVFLDAAAPHIIFPKSLRSMGDEPALAVSLGHAKFDTQPLTETEKQRRLAAAQTSGEDEDWHYYSSTATFSKFYVELGTLASVLDRPGSGFMLVPEVAFCASVLQLIDEDMAENREKLIVRMTVPKLCMACSVGQAHTFCSMVDHWLLYLHDARPENEDDSEAGPSAESALLRAENLLAVAVAAGGGGSAGSGGSGVAGGARGMSPEGVSSAEETYYASCVGSAPRLLNRKHPESEGADAAATSAQAGSPKGQGDLPFIRLHVKVEELGINIFEDDATTLLPLATPRFTMAFTTAIVTSHIRTQKQLLEMVLEEPYCLDSKNPKHLIVSAAAIHCSAEAAPGMPMQIDIVLEPSLKFCFSTSCMELLESIVDITNLISTTSDALPQLVGGENGTGNSFTTIQEGAGGQANIMQELQLRLVERLCATPDKPVAHLSLRIAGTATIELMERRPLLICSKEHSTDVGEGSKTEEEQQRDVPIAFVTFTEVTLMLKKNSVTMEVSGSIQEMTVTLSDEHDVSVSNRVVVQRRALTPSECSTVRAKADAEGNEAGDKLAAPAVLSTPSSSDLANIPLKESGHKLQLLQNEQQHHLTFAYRTSRPVMPIFQAGPDGKRKLMNVSELRFTGFAELEFSSSAIHLDVNSIMTLSQYFSQGLFAELPKLSFRPRYDGRVPVGRPFIEPPQLLTNLRVFARDLVLILPVDARTCSANEHFRISVDHVAVQSSLLSAEEKQSMNISLREIQLLHDFARVDADGESCSKKSGKVLMPTTSLDVSLKSPLDQLSNEPLYIELRGDELVLFLTESDIVDLCRLVSGNLTRKPPMPPPPAPHTTMRPSRGLSLSGASVEGEDATEPSVAVPAPDTTQEPVQRAANVVWRAGCLVVSLLDASTKNARFRLEGSSFTFEQLAPDGALNLHWDKLELHDVYEETCRSTMLLCGCGRVGLRNSPTPRDTLRRGSCMPEMNEQGNKDGWSSSDISSAVDCDEILSEKLRRLACQQQQDVGPTDGVTEDVLDVLTLAIDFTLERFTISDQWLAVYDFVCNEAVVNALHPTVEGDAEAQQQKVCEEDQKAQTTAANDVPFRCLVTTRSVNVPFLTTSREEFIEADITSLNVDVVTYLDTKNITVCMNDLVVRHCASGERIVFKKHDTSDSQLLLRDATEETLLATDSNLALSPRTPEGVTPGAGSVAGHFAAAVDAPAAKPTPDIFNMWCHFDESLGKPRQQVTMAVGGLAVLFSAPLVAQIVDYCSQPNQPIAKISNLGVMRERREWLARAAGEMVNNGALHLQLLWQQPRIILAGNAYELSNKSRNIEARLGFMRSLVFFDKRSGSCTVSTKVTRVSIPEMLEDTTLHLKYQLEKRNADISIVVDKTTALFHPAGVERLLCVIQWNLMAPGNVNAGEDAALGSDAKPVSPVIGSPNPSSAGREGEGDITDQGDEEEPSNVSSPVEGPISQKIHLEASSVVLAMHDVLGLNVHTASLSGLQVDVAPSGDMVVEVQSLVTVEHFTNKRLMESCGDGALTIFISKAEKTTYVTLGDMNFKLVPKAVGSLFNMLLSVQLPPPPPAPTPPPAAPDATAPAALTTAGTELEHRLLIKTSCSRTVALLDNRKVFVAKFVSSTIDLRTYADTSSTLEASIGSLTVEDAYSKNTNYIEIVKPLTKPTEDEPNVVEFSLSKQSLHRSAVVGVANGCKCASAPFYAQQLRCRLASFSVVLIPDVTYAIIQVLADVQGNISDVNRGKAYDYVAEKTAQQISESRQLTEVEVAIGRPCILLVDTASSESNIEVFLGDFIIRNELRCAQEQEAGIEGYVAHTEVFSLSINRLSFNILNNFAFSHSGSIEVEFLRLIMHEDANSVVTGESSEKEVEYTSNLSVYIPTLSAKLTQEQLNCLLDVVGSFRSMGSSSSSCCESFGGFVSSTSQVVSAHYEAGASATSLCTSNVALPTAGGSGRRRPKDAPQGLPVQNTGLGQLLAAGDVNMPPAVGTNNGNRADAPSPGADDSSMKIKAVMRRLEANIDDKFDIVIDQLEVTQLTKSLSGDIPHNSDNSNSNSAPHNHTVVNTRLLLEEIVIRHYCAGRGTGPSKSAYLFVSRTMNVENSSSMLVSGSVGQCENSTSVDMDCLHVTITPKMLVDARDVLYGPFCTKVLHAPLSPIPVYRLTEGTHTLESDLRLDPNHIMITANKTRCCYTLDLNQYILHLCGSPSPLIVLDDNCHLTITNGRIVVPGMYALSSFVSFGFNTTIFTAESCWIEKVAHHERVPLTCLRPASRRSRGGLESSGTSLPRNAVSSSVGTPRQCGGVASLNSTCALPQGQTNFSPPQVVEEEMRSTVGVRCREVMVRMMMEEAEDIGIRLLMSLDVTTTQQGEGSTVMQRCTSVAFKNIHTATKDEVVLQGTTINLCVSGVNKISLTGSVESRGLCLRVSLLRSMLELARDIMNAFQHSPDVQLYPVKVTFEDEDHKQLIQVSTVGECRVCENAVATLAEGKDQPGILCYRCCTGKAALPETNAWFTIEPSDILLLGDSGEMLQIRCVTPLDASFTVDRGLQVQMKLQVRNLNHNSAVWEPLVEHLTATLGGDVLTSAYWLKIDRLDYVVSPENVELLKNLLEDFSPVSDLQKQLQRKFHESVCSASQHASEDHAGPCDDGACKQPAEAKNTVEGIGVAYVEVQNFFNEPLDFDGQPIGPRGGQLSLEKGSNSAELRRTQRGDSAGVRIDWMRSPKYVRYPDIVIQVQTKLSHREDYKRLFRTVMLRCYPVHHTDMIICFKNNISAHMEIIQGERAVGPRERYYFQPNFSLDQRLQLRPVFTVDGEEYSIAVTADTGVAPTLRGLLNASSTTLHSYSTGAKRNLFVVKMTEQQEGIWAGTPVFVVSIEPQIRIENNLPCGVFVCISKDVTKQQNVFSSVVGATESVDVILGNINMEKAGFYFEVHHKDENDNKIAFVTQKHVTLSTRPTCLTLHAQSATSKELRIKVRYRNSKVILSTPYCVVNFTPLPLQLRECNSSGEEISRVDTNFTHLPSNMMRAYPASPRSAEAEKFFVNIRIFDFEALAIPFHVQGRGVIVLESKASSSSGGRGGAGTGVKLFHLMYLAKVDMYGSCFVTIAPRWTIVNRTMRQLYIAQAVSVSETVSTSVSVRDPQPAAGGQVANGRRHFRCRPDMVQVVPPHSATPMFVTGACSQDVGYTVFVLVDRDAAVHGDPVSLEEIACELVLAHGHGGNDDTEGTSMIVETSVVVDGPYTFFTIQDLPVPPYIALNRTPMTLELNDPYGNRLARVSPGCTAPFAIDPRDKACRTRVSIRSASVDSPDGKSVTSGAQHSVEVAQVSQSTSYVEFNFHHPMKQEEMHNELDIGYTITLGPFGQQIIELIIATDPRMNLTCASATGDARGSCGISSSSDAWFGRSMHKYQPPRPTSFDVVLNLSYMNISLLTMDRGIVLAAVADTRLHLVRDGTRETLEFSVANIQIDNQCEEKPVYEVCLAAIRTSPDMQCICGYLERTVVPARALVVVDDVCLHVVPVAVRLSDNVLVAFATFGAQLISEVPMRCRTPTEQELFDSAPMTVGAMNTRVILGRMVVNPLVVRVWFKREVDGHDFIREHVRVRTAALLSMMIHSCEDVHIALPGLAMQERSGSAGVFVQWLIQAYVDSLHHRMGGLFFQYASSLPLIGAPIKLVSCIGSGALKFFQEPISGLSDSPKAFARGLATGSAAFLREAASGGLGAVSNLAKTGAGIMDIFGSGSRTSRRSGGATDVGMLRGITSGVKGVVTAPIVGAAEGGAGGLLLGMGKGVIGLVTKPVAGLLSDVSRITNTVAQACDNTHIPLAKRSKKLREFHATGAVADYDSLVSVVEYERGEHNGSRWVRGGEGSGNEQGIRWVSCTKEQMERNHCDAGKPELWQLHRYGYKLLKGEIQQASSGELPKESGP